MTYLRLNTRVFKLLNSFLCTPTHHICKINVIKQLLKRDKILKRFSHKWNINQQLQQGARLKKSWYLQRVELFAAVDIPRNRATIPADSGGLGRARPVMKRGEGATS